MASPTPRLGTHGISLGEFQLGNATAATKAHPRAAACTTALNYTWAALCKNAPNAETSRRCRKAGKCSPPPAQAHRPQGAAEPGVTGGGTACEHSLPGFRDRTARSGNRFTRGDLAALSLLALPLEEAPVLPWDHPAPPKGFPPSTPCPKPRLHKSTKRLPELGADDDSL